MSNPWVLAIALVKFDEKYGQKIQCIYPNMNIIDSTSLYPISTLTIHSSTDQNCFNNQILTDLCMLCMPDNLESYTKEHNLLYTIKLHNKSNNNDSDINGFINFHQYSSNKSSRGYIQQSIVILSLLPYNNLFYQILIRLNEVLLDMPEYDRLLNNVSNEIAVDSNDINVIELTFEVAFQHFINWELPQYNMLLVLPFYGNMIRYIIPNKRIDNNISRLVNPIVSNDLLDNLSNQFNYISIFTQLGLLSHLITIWENLISGRNILIYSTNVAISSTVVLACRYLLSMVIEYNGDCRPYINLYDNDITNLSTCSNHILIGITNPFLLKSFQTIDCCIFIPNPIAANVTPSNLLTNSLFTKSLISSKKIVTTSTSNKHKCIYNSLGIGIQSESSQSSSHSSKLIIMKSNDKIEKYYDQWISRDSNRYTYICVRHKPVLLYDREIDKQISTMLTTTSTNKLTTNYTNYYNVNSNHIITNFIIMKHFYLINNWLISIFYEIDRYITYKDAIHMIDKYINNIENNCYLPYCIKHLTLYNRKQVILQFLYSNHFIYKHLIVKGENR